MITGVIGLPRAGKSTFLSYCAECALSGKRIYMGKRSWKVPLTAGKKFDTVYSNFPIYGCQKFDFDDLGVLQFENCLILIDEIMLFCDSRNWKSFGENLKYFFAMAGHYHCEIIWCSQSWRDCDVKIRDRTDQLCMIRKHPFLSGFSYVVPLIKHIETQNGQICEWYDKAPLLSCSWLRRSRYYWRFDSYTRQEFPPVPVHFWEFPAGLAPPVGLLGRLRSRISDIWAARRQGGRRRKQPASPCTGDATPAGVDDNKAKQGELTETTNPVIMWGE